MAVLVRISFQQDFACQCGRVHSIQILCLVSKSLGFAHSSPWSKHLSKPRAIGLQFLIEVLSCTAAGSVWHVGCGEGNRSCLQMAPCFCQAEGSHEGGGTFVALHQLHFEPRVGEVWLPDRLAHQRGIVSIGKAQSGALWCWPWQHEHGASLIDAAKEQPFEQMRCQREAPEKWNGSKCGLLARESRCHVTFCWDAGLTCVLISSRPKDDFCALVDGRWLNCSAMEEKNNAGYKQEEAF